MFNSGDVVLAQVQFVDSGEAKQRPALVLFEEFGNVVVAGITSNRKMKGVPLGKKDGMVKDSVIKLNYIFTISESAVRRFLFSLPAEKRKEVYRELTGKIEGLKS